jgi:hypothetical protein
MATPNPDLYKSYFDDPTLSDLTLKLSDRTVHVHRIVLCRASEYFTSLLAGKFQVFESDGAGHTGNQANSQYRKALRKKSSSMTMIQGP